MPLRCLDETGRSLHAFDFTEDGWDALADENRAVRALAMPCCQAEVVLKRSKRRLKFFAHKVVGACEAPAETEEHLLLKSMAVEAARAAGWDAQTEVEGTAPDGAMWRADVLATKGRHRLAIEVQWSSQTEEETRARQARYAASGIRGLWLFRQPLFEIAAEVPAICVGGEIGGRFVAMLAANGDLTARDRKDPTKWVQRVPMDEALRAVFDRRFSYGPLLGGPCSVTVEVATQKCWREQCGCSTKVVETIMVDLQGSRQRLRLDELGPYPDLVRAIEGRRPARCGIGAFVRTPQADGRITLENSCASCGAVVYWSPGWQLDHTHAAYSFETIYDDALKRAVDACGDPGLHWQMLGVECTRPGHRSAARTGSEAPRPMRGAVLGLPGLRARPRLDG